MYFLDASDRHHLFTRHAANALLLPAVSGADHVGHALRGGGAMAMPPPENADGALRLRVDELDGAQSLGIDDGAGGEHAGELGIADRGEDRLDGIHLQDDVRLQSFRGEETIDELAGAELLRQRDERQPRQLAHAHRLARGERVPRAYN